jgi:DNA-damage-inducible protein J
MAKPANDVVRARVNREVKQEATEVLAAIGLTPSDAYRMLLARIVEEQALPFEPLVPNATTIAAMRESRTADLRRFDSVEALMSDLDADD